MIPPPGKCAREGACGCRRIRGGIVAKSGLCALYSPMHEREEDPLQSATAWLRANRNVAMATVTRTWGSAPRPAGSQMAVRDDGAFAGSVSGGCVEGAVIGEAQAALEDGKARNLRYGVSNEDAWAVGLACGGTIEINVAPVLETAQRDALQARIQA